MISTQVQRYGHYSVNGQVHLNKNNAIIAAGMNLSNVKFIYNDEIFDRSDWTTEPEPSVSITEFYRRRALQIRNSYDYVILMYSGGPDSTNVLNSFVNNNLLIDEIVNVNSYHRTGVVNGTIHNADYVYNAKPFLDSLVAEKNLQSKITILDEIDLVQQHWKYSHTQGNDDLLFGAVPAPGMIITKQIWVKYVPHIWKMILAGKKICIVLGSDKTSLTVVNGKYATSFPDILLTDTSLMNSYDQDLKHLNLQEMFYHSPDCTDLIIKQAHILKNFVDRHALPTDFVPPNSRSNLSKTNHRPSYICQSKHSKEHLKYDIYHTLLYPGYTANIITPKTTHMITRPIDNWWIKDLESNGRNMFYHLLLHNVKKLTGTLGYDKNRLVGFPGIYTKPYYLEV